MSIFIRLLFLDSIRPQLSPVSTESPNMKNLPLLLLLNCLNFLVASDITQHPNWHLLDHENCGESVADRIIGGKTANLGEFPWMAKLGYKNTIYENNKVAFKCGGSLINNMYVLTAAHCVAELEGEKLAVIRLGEHNTKTKIDCENDVCAPPVQEYKPSEIIFHKRYQDPQLRNDIALIRLSHSATLHPFVSPICLPHGPLLHKNHEGSTMQVAGWGIKDMATRSTSPVLLHVTVPVVPLKNCEQALEGYAPVGEGQVCAGGKEGFDSCGGDSGGPLMAPAAVDGPPKFYLLGVVSFGASECGSNVPAVYTDVAKFMTWILDHMKP